MKQYLEAVEIVTDEKQEVEFIRTDVTGKSATEIAEIQNAVEDVMAGMHYQLQQHLCGHDDNRSCEITLIKEVI